MENKPELINPSWKIAQSKLQNLRDGTKLPYTAEIDKKTGLLVPRKGHEKEFKKYETTESFIKFKGEIYQIPKGFTIGQGFYAKIKLKRDSKGALSALKIQSPKDVEDTKEYIESITHEHTILETLNLSNGVSVRYLSNTIKTYIDMPYFGISLESILEQSIELRHIVDKIKPYKLYLYLKGTELKCTFKDSEHCIQELTLTQKELGDDYELIINRLKNGNYKFPDMPKPLKEKLYQLAGFPNELDDEARHDLAIFITLKLANLHEKGISHGDIKPANVTLDSKGPHFIDFGFSKTTLTQIMTHDTAYGTPIYMPCFKKMTIKEYMNLVETDLFALKRLLFLPRLLYTKNGHVNLENDLRIDFNYKKRSLLTQSLIDKHKLAPYIDTSSTIDEKKYCIKDNLNARTLAAILITAKYSLPYQYENLIKNEGLCKKITQDFEQVLQNLYSKPVLNFTQPNNHGFFTHKRVTTNKGSYESDLCIKSSFTAHSH